MSLDEVVSTFEADFAKILVHGVEADLVLIPYVGPFLAMPVVRNIVDLLVTWLVDKAMHRVDVAGYYAYSSIRNQGQATDYEKSALAHKEVQANGGTPEQIKSAEDARLAAAAKLIELSG